MKMVAAPAPSPSEAKMQPAPVLSPQVPAQPVPTPTASVASVQFRTIEEGGKPPLKCRVMVTWRTPEGHKASQLQAVDSGEILTIVESTPLDGTAANHGKVTATLYHWGHNTSAPAGVPTPPLPSFAKAMPTGAPIDAVQPKAKDVAKAPEPAKVSDLAKTNSMAKASDTSNKVAWKPAETDRTADSQTAAEVAKAMDMFKAPAAGKANNSPQPAALPMAADTTKAPV